MYLSDLHNPAAGGSGGERATLEGKRTHRAGAAAGRSRTAGVFVRAGAGVGAPGRHGWRLRSATLRSRASGGGPGQEAAAAMAARGPGSCSGPGGLA